MRNPVSPSNDAALRRFSFQNRKFLQKKRGYLQKKEGISKEGIPSEIVSARLSELSQGKFRLQWGDMLIAGRKK
ncbi:MAG: hypothetical protein ACYCZR_13205 [Burkholderiales bacterium]